MEIKVSEIPSEGLRVVLNEQVSKFDDLGDDIKVKAPVRAEISLNKTGVVVFLAGVVETRVELECAVCAKAFEMELRSELNVDLSPDKEIKKEEEKELRAGDMEVEFYSDDTIDLVGLLREQILLQLPMRALCREDCRGLCQYCGKDLNEGPCGCEPPTGHPGFSNLKDLLKDKG